MAVVRITSVAGPTQESVGSYPPSPNALSVQMYRRTLRRLNRLPDAVTQAADQLATHNRKTRVRDSHSRSYSNEGACPGECIVPRATRPVCRSLRETHVPPLPTGTVFSVTKPPLSTIAVPSPRLQ
jgi:hypothetical protein